VVQSLLKVHYWLKNTNKLLLTASKLFTWLKKGRCICNGFVSIVLVSCYFSTYVQFHVRNVGIIAVVHKISEQLMVKQTNKLRNWRKCWKYVKDKEKWLCEEVWCIEGVRLVRALNGPPSNTTSTLYQKTRKSSPEIQLPKYLPIHQGRILKMRGGVYVLQSPPHDPSLNPPQNNPKKV